MPELQDQILCIQYLFVPSHACVNTKYEVNSKTLEWTFVEIRGNNCLVQSCRCSGAFVIITCILIKAK